MPPHFAERFVSTAISYHYASDIEKAEAINKFCMLVQFKDKVKLWKEKGKANNVKGCANGRSSFFTKQRKEKEAKIKAAAIQILLQCGRGESIYAVNEQMRRHVKGGGSSLVSLQQRHPKDGLRMAKKELMLFNLEVNF